MEHKGGTRLRRSDGILEKDCTDVGAAEDKKKKERDGLPLCRRVAPDCVASSPRQRIRRTPYHWWNLSSPAAPWPPKPAIDLLSLLGEGALTKGGRGGYGCSVTSLCPAEGLNLGLEQLGSSEKKKTLLEFKPQSNESLAQIQPRFDPGVNSIACMCPLVTVFRGVGGGACRGSAAVGRRGGGGVILRIYAWSAGRVAGLHQGTDTGTTWGQGSGG